MPKDFGSSHIHSFPRRADVLPLNPLVSAAKLAHPVSGWHWNRAALFHASLRFVPTLDVDLGRIVIRHQADDYYPKGEAGSGADPEHRGVPDAAHDALAQVEHGRTSLSVSGSNSGSNTFTTSRRTGSW